LQDTIFYRIFS